MTNVLVITQRFYPPWSHGTVSYAKGLVDTILETDKCWKNLEVTVLSSREKTLFPELHSQEMNEYLENRSINLEYFCTSENKYQGNLWRIVRKLSQIKDYDIIHLLVPGCNPLWLRIATRKRNIILKHIFIYPSHSGFTTEKLGYNFFQKNALLKLLNIDLAFSSEILQKIYYAKGLAMLPPAIDTDFYRPKPKSDHNYQALTKCPLKFGNISEVLQKDFVLFYMGPILHERFDFKSVIDGLTMLRKKYCLNAGLAIAGREVGSVRYFEEMRNYINKNDMGDCVFTCLKNLSEVEKICLFNDADVFIYPFPTKLGMSVAFPPIALLESMSAGLCVVSGGLPYLNFLIKNGDNGILIKKTIDEKTFAEGVWNALSDKRKISQNARLTIEQNFSIQSVSKLYADFLSNVMIR